MVGGVLTVPMRNGNRGSFTSGFFPSSGSYRTYEEWKRRATSSSELGKISVLTVPMRNGNRFSKDGRMTTWIVLTVPMRNGNATI